MTDERLREACKGKSKSQGGLNVDDLKRLAAATGAAGTGRMTRDQLLLILCGTGSVASAPRAAAAPKRSALPVDVGIRASARAGTRASSRSSSKSLLSEADALAQIASNLDEVAGHGAGDLASSMGLDESQRTILKDYLYQYASILTQISKGGSVSYIVSRIRERTPDSALVVLESGPEPKTLGELRETIARELEESDYIEDLGNDQLQTFLRTLNHDMALVLRLGAHRAQSRLSEDSELHIQQQGGGHTGTRGGHGATATNDFKELAQLASNLDELAGHGIGDTADSLGLRRPEQREVLHKYVSTYSLILSLIAKGGPISDIVEKIRDNAGELGPFLLDGNGQKVPRTLGELRRTLADQIIDQVEYVQDFGSKKLTRYLKQLTGEMSLILMDGYRLAEPLLRIDSELRLQQQGGGHTGTRGGHGATATNDFKELAQLASNLDELAGHGIGDTADSLGLRRPEQREVLHKYVSTYSLILSLIAKGGPISDIVEKIRDNAGELGPFLLDGNGQKVPRTLGELRRTLADQLMDQVEYVQDLGSKKLTRYLEQLTGEMSLILMDGYRLAEPRLRIDSELRLE
jgi:hypothetical protein